ncbi:ABC transporter ATP-binding protein [Anaerotignum sp.]|uniref:ABC transporter ATP-binding protein n=1 Tax=Anaerotignum sp. TaxID=2039241 RepID=UPI0028B1516D|nr:ABC transporter ATP-binding protein [Anaerotignum sp.]
MKITVDNLTLKLNNRPILKNINLELTANKLIMLLGENGAGKTQFIKTILGFQHPDSGNIFYGDKNIKSLNLNERAKKLAYVSQEADPGVRYRVRELISMGNTPHINFFGKPSEEMKRKEELIMKEIGIWDLRNCFIDEISGGECRLAYLCKALVQDTPWLVLDEPTAFLDFKKQHSFLKILKDLSINQGKGVFMSIHNPSIATEYGDVLVLFKNGELIDIINKEKDGYGKLSMALSKLYEHEIVFEDTSKGKVLIWKE